MMDDRRRRCGVAGVVDLASALGLVMVVAETIGAFG